MKLFKSGTLLLPLKDAKEMNRIAKKQAVVKEKTDDAQSKKTNEVTIEEAESGSNSLLTFM